MKKFKDNSLYKQVKPGVYEPVGINDNTVCMGDGIWYVHHHNTGKTSGEYLARIWKLGDVEVVNYARLCGMQDLSEKVLMSDELHDMTRNVSFSIGDVVRATIKAIENISQNEELSNQGSRW